MHRTCLECSLETFPKDHAQIISGEAPEWMVGTDKIVVEHLVLVSLKRITVGSWVPYVRLINHHE